MNDFYVNNFNDSRKSKFGGIGNWIWHIQNSQKLTFPFTTIINSYDFFLIYDFYVNNFNDSRKSIVTIKLAFSKSY